MDRTGRSEGAALLAIVVAWLVPSTIAHGQALP